MSLVLLVGLALALAVIIAARRRRPRITQIDRTVVRKDGDDA